MKIIGAVDSDFGIGKDGDLPWNVKNDLRFFRFMTYGDDVIMGRTTYENTPNLSGRRIVVLTSQTDYDAPHVANSIAEANEMTSDDAWIGGGESVYRQYMGQANEIVLSNIRGVYGCDQFFPRIGENYELKAKFRAQGFTVTRHIND